MTGTERLRKIFKGQPVDRIAWTTIADPVTRSIMPENIRQMQLLDFYRHIGCDIFQFGNYGMPEGSEAKYPYEYLRPPMEVTERIDENEVYTKCIGTEWGNLTSVFRKGHPIKYPVQTLEDLRVFRRIMENTRVVLDSEGCLESSELVKTAIGEDGIFVPTIGPSPVQRLLELEMGTEGFYYLLYDHEEEVAGLIEVMHEVQKQEYRYIAEKMPFDLCIPVENTSTTYISPDIYRKYSLKHIKDFVDIMHSGGKKAVIHMCGLLYHLLDEIRETGLDGIHALTPPPIGDVSYEHVLDTLGEDLIIIGCMDSAVFQKTQVTKAEIEDWLNMTFTSRIRKSNFILWPVADGLPTEVDRFYAIKEWMEKNGVIC